MKKFFSIVATALILLGAASCKKDEPTSPNEFTIEMSFPSSGVCAFTITPSNEKVEYMFMFIDMSMYSPKEEFKANVKTYIENSLADSQKTYADYKSDGSVKQGKFSDSKGDWISANPNPEYILAVFQIDNQLKVVGDVTISSSFYPLPFVL